MYALGIIYHKLYHSVPSSNIVPLQYGIRILQHSAPIFPLQCMKVKSESEVTQLCPTLSNPMDCSLPGSSIHGIFQARVLEWGAIAFSVKSCQFYLLNISQISPFTVLTPVQTSVVISPPDDCRSSLMCLSSPSLPLSKSFSHS